MWYFFFYSYTTNTKSMIQLKGYNFSSIKSLIGNKKLFLCLFTRWSCFFNRYAGLAWPLTRPSVHRALSSTETEQLRVKKQMQKLQVCHLNIQTEYRLKQVSGCCFPHLSISRWLKSSFRINPLNFNFKTFFDSMWSSRNNSWTS